VGALGQQVQVELAEDRAEPVRILDLVFLVAVIGEDAQAVAERGRVVDRP